ncbi:MAG: CBS domain-containing protein [Desulfobacteraceae bacterium]|nr:CBS domain-containing protein [Desulfobacteraceae bacterium]MBC2750510.1 CBS domain-containing protein [Desulfobacteraceae bacterium]
MASLLAAQKLYPGAVVVFPGSQEKNLRNFFINSMVYLFNMTDIKDIDFSSVKKLVLVDTRQAKRIGKMAALLSQPGIEIHVYDHHPPAPNDIEGHFVVHELTGANVTLLVEKIRKKRIPISADEATIMGLGVYEDTGSFTFPSTTERDLKTAAWLLSKGANLNIITDLITREITPEQVTVLNDLIQRTIRHHIHGIDIVVTSVTTPHYMPDFAFLVHKMMRMENIDAIFAIARMDNKIHIVARSRVPEVNAGLVLTDFGGGGHANAAAASVKNKTLAQTEHELVDALYNTVRHRRRASDVMSAPPICIDAHLTCGQAAELVNRYSINALLVTQKDRNQKNLLGYITRQVIEKALYHHLSMVSVSEYMTTDIAQVAPDAELDEIQEKIIENKQRILPVVGPSGIMGVITRTDLLNLLVRSHNQKNDRLNGQRTHTVHVRTRVILKFMRERLSARLIELLQSIGSSAEALGYNAYVIGGFVRDLFLYHPNEDIDVVIEGDGIAFARQFSKETQTRIHTHEKFGTAVVIFPDGFKIDIASARMEYYEFPAALPTVEMSSLKLDLFRRDFTINTLCIQLNPNKFGTLIDFFTAQKDLKEKTVRVLHNLSFVEDPTRAFRAIRFEQRFGFTIGKLTVNLIHNAVRMDFFKRLSGKRVFSELRQILKEENPTPAIVRLNDFNLLKVIHPSIELTDSLVNLFTSTKKVIAWYDLLFMEESYMKWAVYFMGLAHSCDMATTMDICRQFELTPRLKTIFGKERFAAKKSLLALERNTKIDNSAIYRELAPFRIEIVLYMMAAARTESVRKAISHFCVHLRFIEPLLKGKDLRALGLPPGPSYRKILDAIQDQKLNGHLETREDELIFARRLANLRKP